MVFEASCAIKFAPFLQASTAGQVGVACLHSCSSKPLAAAGMQEYALPGHATAAHGSICCIQSKQAAEG
jgi:hypothetical protein